MIAISVHIHRPSLKYPHISMIRVFYLCSLLPYLGIRGYLCIIRPSTVTHINTHNRRNWATVPLCRTRAQRTATAFRNRRRNPPCRSQGWRLCCWNCQVWWVSSLLLSLCWASSISDIEGFFWINLVPKIMKTITKPRLFLMADIDNSTEI